MTLDEIKQLIDFIRERDLSELELERADFKLRIKSGATVQAVAPPVVMAAPAGCLCDDLAIARSAIVCTFYRAAEPGAKAFGEVGDSVREGQVLCIIEA